MIQAISLKNERAYIQRPRARSTGLITILGEEWRLKKRNRRMNKD